MTKWWMIRAGRNADFIDDFISKGAVSLGGEEGCLKSFQSQKEVLEKVSIIHPDWKPGKKRIWASQIYRFAHEIESNDWVLTYNPQQRVYHIGKITGEYCFQPQFISNHPHYHSVKWVGVVNRDNLSTTAKYSLGAISSLFQIPSEVGAEIESILNGKQPIPKIVDGNTEGIEEIDLLEDPEVKAIENIKDRLSRLDWEEMQELVAGILRAMGYKTDISPKGSDRGKDIVASPDGLGFEEPRIVVEVKHKERTSIGSESIRSFLGGRHPGDKGLYVSTGGFTKDAYYEAERAKIPITLMNLDDLVKRLIENYEKLDMTTRQLVPLKKLFWPM